MYPIAVALNNIHCTIRRCTVDDNVFHMRISLFEHRYNGISNILYIAVHNSDDGYGDLDQMYLSLKLTLQHLLAKDRHNIWDHDHLRLFPPIAIAISRH